MNNLSELSFFRDLEQLDHYKRKIKDHSTFDLIDRYSDEDFRQRYRMCKATFFELLEEIKGCLEKSSNRGRPVPAIVQLIVTLRYFATGTIQQVDGDLLGISQTTVSDVISRTSEAIAKLRTKYIMFPREDECASIKCGFYSMIKKRDLRYRAFPNVIVCIDGTHIGVDARGVPNREIFRNRKQKITVNVQAICDHDLQFLDVVARWHGSVHDARIFAMSNVKQILESGNYNGWLLGDSAYAQTTHMMTPIQGPKNDGEKRYNFSHCQICNSIERACGALKRRFAILSDHIRQSMDNSSYLTQLSVTLAHNPKDSPHPHPFEVFR